jgi:hypothetical protein
MSRTLKRTAPYFPLAPEDSVKAIAEKSSSPLAQVMGGNKSAADLNPKQQATALDDAIAKLGRVTKAAQVSKENALETGAKLMHTGETLASAFMGSMAEGYFGPEKVQIGGVDLRLAGGVLMTGAGLYQTLMGQRGGADHFLAIGTGLNTSYLADVGRQAGQKLATKGIAGPGVGWAQVPGPIQGAMHDPYIGGPRNLMLTEEGPAPGRQARVTGAEEEELSGPRRRHERREGRREGRQEEEVSGGFVRARVQE